MLRETHQYGILYPKKGEKGGALMSIGGMNNWNNNDQARMRMENTSLENKM